MIRLGSCGGVTLCKKYYIISDSVLNTVSTEYNGDAACQNSSRCVMGNQHLCKCVYVRQELTEA